MNTKDTAIEVIKTLADDVDWEDIMYSLYVRQKVQNGAKDFEEGRIVSHEDLKRKLLHPMCKPKIMRAATNRY